VSLNVLMHAARSGSIFFRVVVPKIENTKPTTTTARLSRSDVVSEERHATAANSRPYPVRRRNIQQAAQQKISERNIRKSYDLDVDNRVGPFALSRR